MRYLHFLLVFASSTSAAAQASVAPPPTAVANDNRSPAGTLTAGVLRIHLVLRRAVWYPEQEGGPAKIIAAVGEAGHAPRVPAPLLRVPLGTSIHATITNSLPDTVAFIGIAGRTDTLWIMPGGEVNVRHKPDVAGSFLYAGSEKTNGQVRFGGTTGQMVGGLIVDDARSHPDRILIATSWDPVPIAGEPHFLAMNGKSWPFTEKFEHTVGDTVRWRVLNGSQDGSADHPMHLHGFYFRVDARGGWGADTLYADSMRRSVVTENLPGLSSMSLTWIPERAGNWLFHCHNADHVAGINRHAIAGRARPYPAAPVHDAQAHLDWDMSGLAHAITIRPHARVATYSPGTSTRTLRMLVQQKPKYFGEAPGFGYVLQDGRVAPSADSIMIPGPRLVLKRGETVDITVINNLAIHTAVHWHGIELESFYDGVAGWSGSGDQRAPMIAPGDSFVVRMTPPRAGTFMYHAHMTDRVQLARGLYGALIVQPPGASGESGADHIVIISFGRPGGKPGIMVNGSIAPAAIVRNRGGVHRVRILNIATENNAVVTLSTGSGLIEWTLVAKDGFDTPRSQRITSRARVHIFPGETYDFEFKSDAPVLHLLTKNPSLGAGLGEVRLELHTPRP